MSTMLLFRTRLQYKLFSYRASNTTTEGEIVLVGQIVCWLMCDVLWVIKKPDLSNFSECVSGSKLREVTKQSLLLF